VADTDPEVGTRWRTRVQSAVHPDGRPGMLEAGSHRVVPVEGDALPLAVPELDALHLTRRRFPGVTRIELAAGTDSGAIVLRGPDAAAAAQDLVPVLEHVPGDWSVLSAAAAPASSAARRSGGRRSRGRGGRNRGGGAAVPLTLHTGSGFVTESVPGLGRSLRVRGAGFWQVHRDAAALLTRAVRSAVWEPGDGQVLDLYSGAGLLGIALAEDGHRVLGIEGSAEAVEDARANAHGLDARFTAGRVETAALVADARVAVLDPPRAGAGAAVVDALTASAVERIVHVACDGATLARDLRRLADGGFRIESVVAHDLFPLTGHLEFVAVLSR
jgi:tRNA/tmRNA/rRNA uracil-C5-methylase (TrmA/RlmC/RlmD family)